MENWQRNIRCEVMMVDMEALVPEDHLLRKIEGVMNYDSLCERPSLYYCHTNGRNGTEPCGAGKDGAAPTPLQNPIAATNLREDQGYAVVSVVLGVWVNG